MNQIKLFQKSIYLFLPLLLAACVVSHKTSMAVLLKADSDFSTVSKEHGVKTAFLQYIDDSAVLLKPNTYPIVGAAAKQFYLNQISADYSLTWAPQAETIAHSGELGYTYGIWTLAAKDTTLQGTYVTIWKKQKDGSWKFVLDTGNSGVGSK
jgi:ketosteroid isomerase-like protein